MVQFIVTVTNLRLSQQGTSPAEKEKKIANQTQSINFQHVHSIHCETATHP